MSYKQLTLKDLAKQLNTSITTVSRALKGHYSISESMRTKVLELAKQLDFHPNPMALNLLKSRSFTIGVIVPEIAHHFYSMVMEGIEETAVAAGYNVMFCASKESSEKEEDVVNALLQSRIDGLLIAPSKETINYTHLQNIVNKGMPLIFFDRHSADLRVSKVLVNDYEGAMQATNHLLENGCKRIAHIAGPKKLSNSIQRLHGYKDALKNSRIKIDKDLIAHCNLTKEGVADCIEKLLSLKNKPDAIFTYNSFIAFESMLLVKRKGYKIPSDICFIGFANEPVISYIEPQLTTVLLPAYEMGQEATKLFLEQINCKTEKYEPKTVTLQAKLIVKESSLKKKAK
ncbi:LacI family DNA-binding transcriptional regulator [Lacibacter sp.]|uniref:LacI family DNA-binding transcriptional regulator n=1 Tax=Lacibacter sp. TaxID=1915409 RepID=UPI002B4AD7DB|nr:LacI family DNA-binding transcriptional regulator [Lacibacter sp.]HLP36311.1 LacI family DNA-binding transcriptional regulator [Lacibacter sp.]